MKIEDIKSLTISYPTTVNCIQSAVKVGLSSELISPEDIPITVTHLAIWDTGATNSAITELTAKKLNLEPIGGTHMSGLGGTIYKNKYLVDVELPNGVIISNLSVTEIDNPTDEAGVKIDSFCMLIGMDIISRGDFTITNFEGKTTMSFREPSQLKVDYVREWNMKMTVKNKTKRK